MVVEGGEVRKKEAKSGSFLSSYFEISFHVESLGAEISFQVKILDVSQTSDVDKS